MTKPKTLKNNLVSPERLEELRRAALIASTGASTRLAGSKLSDKEVERFTLYIEVENAQKLFGDLKNKTETIQEMHTTFYGSQ